LPAINLVQSGPSAIEVGTVLPQTRKVTIQRTDVRLETLQKTCSVRHG
jgi:hypothetical protein